MFWLLVAALTWTISIWFIWRLVKTGADEDARRDAIRRHIGQL